MERFIRPMAPGWFASVMGTAVTSLALTLASHAAADAGPALADPVALAASALHWLAIAMMSVLGIAAVYRLIRHGDAVMEQLRHPVEGSFYATFPIAMLVMAAVWTIRGVSPALIAPLWWTGALGTFAVSYVVLFGLFTSERLKLGMVTPAHFIPAVGLVVIPVAGAPLAAASEGVLRELAFALNMTGFGAGVFMYVGLLALTMARHFLGAPVEGKMTPTLWVHLAPLSVIPLSMLALLKTTGDASLLRYGSLVAAAFLGAALWWLVLAVSMTIHNRRQGKLPFGGPSSSRSAPARCLPTAYPNSSRLRSCPSSRADSRCSRSSSGPPPLSAPSEASARAPSSHPHTDAGSLASAVFPPQGPSATMAQGPFFLSTPRASSIRIILRFHRTSPPLIPAHLAPFACSSRVRRPPNSPPLSHFISRFLVRLTTSTFGIFSD